MTTGLGMTESARSACSSPNPTSRRAISASRRACRSNWSPSTANGEASTWAPNITPGYWRSPTETADHSTPEEATFCFGDAVTWIDEDNLHLGLKFDGRIAGRLQTRHRHLRRRARFAPKIISSAAPYVQDVVITG